MKRKTLFLSLAAIVAVAALLIALAGVKTPTPGASVTANADRARAVEVTPVARGNIAEKLSAVGTIVAEHDVTVSSETSGRITRVLVSVGDAVRAGQSLVLVDDELKVIAVEQARAALLAAETNHRKARKDFERAEKLSAAGDIAEVELEGNRLAFHSAEAQYKSAAAGLSYAQRQLKDTRISSPIGGEVASKSVEVGELVGPGRAVMNIVDLRTLKVKAAIAEENIARVRLGQAAELRVDGVPGVVFPGVVCAIGAKADPPQSHTYPVEVVVHNRERSPLKAGMFARVDIEAGSADDALTVSKESVVNDDIQPAVYVVEGNITRLRPVRLGIRAGDRVQVTQGVQEGDLIVSFGHRGLKDGSQVQYK